MAADRDRRTAFLTLKDIEENGAWANLALSAHIKKDGAKNPAFVRELVYGCIRNQILLDRNIQRFLKKPGLSVSDRVLLRMGFYQLALMDGTADHAAVNETVALAAAFMKGRQGFINAVLRSFQRDGKRLLSDSLSVRYSCAQWIVDLWTKHYGAEKAEAFLKASCSPAPFTIRANTLKTGRKELAEKLKKLGFEAEETGLSGLCLAVEGTGILDSQLYKDGLFSVQGEASAAAAEMLDPKPGDVFLDLCAAPGGKTCCAAELMKDSGTVKAFDIYPHRAELIKKEAARLGLSSVTAQTADSRVFMPGLESIADCVLADVPCSGLGTLRRNPEIKLKQQSPEDASKALEELAEIQYNILLNALRYVKPGGKALYSTCTVDPVENQDLVRKALKALPGCTIEQERQIFPEEGGPDGFYTCLIRRGR